MASVSGLDATQLQAKIDNLKKQGKTESTSKELGKYVDALKVLAPKKYGAETVASAQNKLLSSTTPETQAQLGLSTGKGNSAGYSASGSTGQPTIDLNKMYEESMNSPEMKALEAELLAKKQARDSAEADVNDNPFYSEATRVGKLAKLDEKALDEIQTLESTMQQKKADAQVKINIATQQYNIESDQYKNNLAKLNTLISTGALSNASGADVAQIAMATGMSVEMVKGIQAKMKSDAVKPTVITSTDDNGNVTVSVIDGNTGQTIGQNSLGAVGNKQQSSGGSGGKNASSQEIAGALSEAMDSVAGGDGHISEESYMSQRNYAASLGIGPDEFDKMFGIRYINPNYASSYNIVAPSVREHFGV